MSRGQARGGAAAIVAGLLLATASLAGCSTLDAYDVVNGCSVPIEVTLDQPGNSTRSSDATLAPGASEVLDSVGPPSAALYVKADGADAWAHQIPGGELPGYDPDGPATYVVEGEYCP